MRRKAIGTFLAAITLVMSICSVVETDLVLAKGKEDKTVNDINEGGKRSNSKIIARFSAGENGVLQYQYNEDGFTWGPSDYEVLPDETVVILDPIGNQILIHDIDGEIKTISLEQYDVTDLYYDDEDILLHCKNGEYLPMTKEGIISNISKKNVTVKRIADSSVLEHINKENTSIGILRSDFEECFYTRESMYDPDSSIIWFEEQICKYNVEGELLEYAILDTDNCVAYPDQPIKIDEKQNIYVMFCREEYTEVCKIELGKNDVSHLEEKMENLEEEFAISQENSVAMYSENSGIALASAAPEYTRYQALLRALSMARLSWTVSASNKNTSLANGTVTLPKYVANATVGTTVMGIPYCWGGFNGYETTSNSQANTRYADIYTKSVVAGNVHTVGSRKSGTVGLDCSGYVSSVLGFDSKKNSTYFLTYGTSISKENMRSMDILVKNGHVMLYAGEFIYEYADGSTEERWIIYDSSTDAGKVAERKLTKAYCSSFSARNPWND